MPIAALMLIAVQMPPTLAAIEALPAVEAGDRALAGHRHEPIESVVRAPPGPLALPDTVELDMVERATIIPDACARQRWRVAFRFGPGGSPDAAQVASAFAHQEVALRVGNVCPAAHYVGLQIGTGVQDAVAALKWLAMVQGPNSAAQFACTDETNSGLCASALTIRKGLRTITPWPVARTGNQMILWLAIAPGQVLTEVRYELGVPGRVTITRRIPAPA